MTEPAVSDGGDLPLWRVATVVFSSVRAVDYTDATHVAERTVERAVRRGPRSVELRPGLVREVTVAEVLDLGLAGGNGYTYTLPSTKAWRQYRNGPSGGLPPGIVGSFDPEEDE